MKFYIGDILRKMNDFDFSNSLWKADDHIGCDKVISLQDAPPQQPTQKVKLYERDTCPSIMKLIVSFIRSFLLGSVVEFVLFGPKRLNPSIAQGHLEDLSIANKSLPRRDSMERHGFWDRTLWNIFSGITSGRNSDFKAGHLLLTQTETQSYSESNALLSNHLPPKVIFLPHLPHAFMFQKCRSQHDLESAIVDNVQLSWQ
ncbi:hypothetical protein YC2023_082282 [Brassica napus]